MVFLKESLLRIHRSCQSYLHLDKLYAGMLTSERLYTATKNIANQDKYKLFRHLKLHFCAKTMNKYSGLRIRDINK